MSTTHHAAFFARFSHTLKRTYSTTHPIPIPQMNSISSDSEVISIALSNDFLSLIFSLIFFLYFFDTSHQLTTCPL